MTAAATLRALHHGRTPDDPLILPNPWDAAGARAFADAGFPALATPSKGVSLSLGYPDGALPPGEMFAAVARIARAVDVPVTADVEDGYGLAPAELVARLLDTGAVGCNLEDTDRITGELKDPHAHADWLAAVRAEAGDALVVNARIDTFLRKVPDAARAALERARLYAAAGADCVYPIFAPVEHLAEIGAAAGLPVNALALPGGPSPRELGQLGASRVTFGPGQYLRTMAAVADIAKELRGE